jgi:hypothetical protein
MRLEQAPILPLRLLDGYKKPQTVTKPSPNLAMSIDFMDNDTK